MPDERIMPNDLTTNLQGRTSLQRNFLLRMSGTKACVHRGPNGPFDPH